MPLQKHHDVTPHMHFGMNIFFFFSEISGHWELRDVPVTVLQNHPVCMIDSSVSRKREKFIAASLLNLFLSKL